MSESPTVRCFYTCADCGLKRQMVDVPERDPNAMNVVAWLETVAVPLLMTDHRRKSPLCQPKTLEEVGIQHSGDPGDHVGTKVRS